ncbi:Serine/threonine-protein kinase env7 [Dimargaris xerosporica]|nr:Serine/threonine-protein kinase env7 [Dimargaris xerosporica]
MSLFQDLVSSMIDMTRTAMSQCFPSSPEVLQINNKTYKVLHRLGEGGFSMVYLIRDLGSAREYAVKKVRCAAGTGGFALAMREVDMYRRFRHPGIIQLCDVSVMQGVDGASSSLIADAGSSPLIRNQAGGRASGTTAASGSTDQTVYMFLPYYRQGNLQDWMQTERAEGIIMDEKKLLMLFLRICEAVQAMHEHEAKDELPGMGTTTTAAAVSPTLDTTEYESYMREDRTKITPYAHRDIKPANIMLQNDGVTPVLMDLGSARKARVFISNRQQALLEQDDAAEHCSMPYRAPELFDVQTNVLLDERVDVWSLGALLYAVAYGESPFESQLNQQGGSIALAVMNGKYHVPMPDPYSSNVAKLIAALLVTDPSERPYIDQVIAKVHQAIEAVP